MSYDSPFLPLPPNVNNPSTFARKVDWSTIGNILEQEIFASPLHDGQPYRLQVSNLPITGPAGPGVIEVTVFERIGYETLARATVCVAHGTAETWTGIGPIRVTARQRVLNTNPQVDFQLTIRPAVAKQIPPLCATEVVGAAYATVALQAGFPASFRSKLTILTDGQIDLRGIDNAGGVVFDMPNVLPIQLLQACPMQWSPELRLQLRGSGAGPATTANIIWTRGD